MTHKLTSLPAAAALIPDGASLSLGGFTTQRHPMALAYELIRLRRRDLYLIGHSPGGDWDVLIGRAASSGWNWPMRPTKP